MKEFDLEERVSKAVDFFEEGYNCSQAVFLAYCDLFNISTETASMMTVSFGGGLGRMREVCGAISSISMLAGFRYPVVDPTNLEQRIDNYTHVQNMAERFKEKYGSIICRDLLELLEKNPSLLTSQTRKYHKPCGLYVAEAAYLAGKMLKGEAYA